MPATFKKRALGTDQPHMSDTANSDVFAAPSGLLLDGEMPRLGSATPMMPNLPAPTIASVDGGPTMPLMSPVLTDDASTTPMPGMPALPSLPMPSLPVNTPPAPVLSAPALTEMETATLAPAPAEPRHPMAHLMPEKGKPSESAIRAAELRAAKKRKGKRIKIGVIVGFLVVAGVVGPPAFKWFSNAVNEAGKTSTDEPTVDEPVETTATSVPATAGSTTPAPAATTVPAATTPAAVAPAPTAPTAPAAAIPASTAPAGG